MKYVVMNFEISPFVSCCSCLGQNASTFFMKMRLVRLITQADQKPMWFPRLHTDTGLCNTMWTQSSCNPWKYSDASMRLLARLLARPRRSRLQREKNNLQHPYVQYFSMYLPRKRSSHCHIRNVRKWRDPLATRPRSKRSLLGGNEKQKAHWSQLETSWNTIRWHPVLSLLLQHAASPCHHFCSSSVCNERCSFHSNRSCSKTRVLKAVRFESIIRQICV